MAAHQPEPSDLAKGCSEVHERCDTRIHLTRAGWAEMTLRDRFSSLTRPEKRFTGELSKQRKIIQRHLHVGFALACVPQAKLERYFHRRLDAAAHQNLEPNLGSASACLRTTSWVPSRLSSSTTSNS